MFSSGIQQKTSQRPAFCKPFQAILGICGLCQGLLRAIFQEPTFSQVRISGHEENAPYGWLRHESGVHRVQRVPVTESKGRMQTSGVAVVLLLVAGEAVPCRSRHV